MPTPSPRILLLALDKGLDLLYPYLELLLMLDLLTPLEGMPGLLIMALGLDHDHEHKRLEQGLVIMTNLDTSHGYQSGSLLGSSVTGSR